jgi:hypothetical protein
MTRKSKAERIDEQISYAKSGVATIERLSALILRTAVVANDRDGLSKRGESPASLFVDPDADVRLTAVEAAAIAPDRIDHNRIQALQVLALLAAADKALSRAAGLALRLEERIPKELRDTVEVTCVEDDCEKLRADGWDVKHPNGVAGRCEACYRRRAKLRRNG